MKYRARVYICPRCGSAASHLEATGLRLCENEECGYLGRNPAFRRGGPHQRHRTARADPPSVSLSGGATMRLPVRYD